MSRNPASNSDIVLTRSTLRVVEEINRIGNYLVNPVNPVKTALNTVNDHKIVFFRLPITDLYGITLPGITILIGV